MLNLFKGKDKEKSEGKEKVCSTVHLKTPDVYCKTCSVILCPKCVQPHQKHINISTDKLYSEITNNSGDIQRLSSMIKDKENEKILIQETYKKEIKEVHDKEIENISKFFRDLHDLLHFKEVEIKRELNSYQDENSETLVINITKLDQDIQISNEFMRDLNSHKDQPNADKLQLIQHYCQMEKEFLQVKSGKNLEYHKYQLDTTKSKQSNQYVSNLTLSKRKSKDFDRIKVVALYDFVGINDDELSFFEGDILIVNNYHTLDGWWEAEMNNTRGYVLLYIKYRYLLLIFIFIFLNGRLIPSSYVARVY
ncbi:hypothetical protein DLAC_07397 [Tieghemostelium lacteum]|uniref:B box-type domain-containing protein n=1 Tax=Tieghemostelium lacteum TaxID=361077 RepID=A0A151ZCH4_TIELA|nr:hypothetical protein DLAC_07397 [Tieghemostelium lacteum]|eukprot:KYQ91625.1 hypothetical protein DLAC_07397 [Tieghemostelium lacteum]